MKKLIASILITIGLSTAVFAQKPSFGLKIGANFASLSEDLAGDDATGFHVGAIFHAPIKRYGVMVEALYSREGSENLELDYINVPVMVTYKIVPGLRAHLGPQFKVNISADADILSGNINADDFNESFEDDIKDLNFDGVVGVEYKLPVVGIFAQVRYVFGLGDLGVDEVKATQNVFQLSLGYRF